MEIIIRQRKYHLQWFMKIFKYLLTSYYFYIFGISNFTINYYIIGRSYSVKFKSVFYIMHDI